MSAVHYKFSSSNDYKNVTFDGLSISVLDCKKAIMDKEKLKMTEVDLSITNAQSLKDFKEDTDLIPKNTALLVRRVPFGVSASADKSKVYIVKKNDTASSKKSGSQYLTLDQLTKTEDLAAANATELDKIKAMMTQSTNEYDPSKYVKPPKPGSYQRYDTSTHSPFVKCFKCNQTGHYATQCRLSKTVTERPKAIRPATGIPRSHMVQVNKDARGAMLTPDGQYVVPFIDKKGYEIGKKEKPPFLPETQAPKEEDEDEPVPDELICLLCKEIMEDAVVIPCCGNSYCDECIRNALLESEDHECPTCHKKNISPDSLIANKFLRQAVNKFRNETGISRKKKNAPVWPRPAPVEAKPVVAPQPTKVTYGPPASKAPTSQPTASTGGAYVVKARSAQIYAAQGYTIKKASHPTTVTTTATPTTTTTVVSTPLVKQEPVEGVVTPANSSLSSETSSAVSTDESAKPVDSGDQNQSITVKTEPVKTEKISAKNMMVERHDQESTPPPPPPTQPDEKQADVEKNDTPPPETDSNAEEPSVETSAPEISEPEPQPAPEEKSLPSLLDDISAENFTSFPIHSQGISITLKNPPLIQTKPDAPPVPLVDPPMHLPVHPRPSAGILGSAPSMTPTIQQPSLSVQPSRISMPPRGMPSVLPPPGAALRLPPPGIIPGTLPPPSIPTSIPPPGLMRPPGQRLGPPPPLGMLPPGMLPPHLRFPPPLSVPPPGFLPQRPPVQSTVDAQVAPPPPGTGTPPTIVTSTSEARKHSSSRSSSRAKRGHREAKSPSKSRKSKLAMMSDEFTREQKERIASRKRKPRKRRSESRSGSESYSSSSYSSSSRSSSRSSYSSSGSSSYSSSYSESRSPSPVQKRKRGKESSKRGRKIVSKKRKARRSVDDDSPRRTSRRDRRRSISRSRSRDRKRRTPKDDSVIPGMPPQSVLDYERDLALYDYYKQKYEQDWLRRRISPPSPFKRFINYDPTKLPPPNSQQQPILRELPPHPSRPMYNQPPPPGDATPTEEDAGLYAYRDRTPERLYAPQAPAPWDPPPFEGSLEERARLLREEEYYVAMQHKLAAESRWGDERGRYPPEHSRYDPRGRPDSRDRELRYADERRRRGRTPPLDRGRKSWERDGERWSSHRRREIEDSRSYRDSRDRDRDGGRRRDAQKESRSSRRDDESRSSRKRGRNQLESSREDSQSKKRSRDSRRAPSPEITQDPEPYPPGEGDATPVRDETRVEFSNESIKVKVINDKAKARSDRRGEKSSTRTQGVRSKTEKSNSASEKMDSDSKSRKVVKVKNQSRKKEIRSLSPNVEDMESSVPLVSERSPTPTLDENASPAQVDEPPLEDSDILDVHARASVSEIDRPPIEESEDSVKVAPQQRKTMERPGKIPNRRTVKKVPSKSTKKAASKVKAHKSESPVADSGSTSVNKDNSEQFGTRSAIAKSRWESDDEAAAGGDVKQPVKEASKAGTSYLIKPLKQRKIRIKKPASRNLEPPPKEDKGEQMEVETSETVDNIETVDKLKRKPSVGDSRRVVVSSVHADRKSSPQRMEEKPKLSSRSIKQSVSINDEATFEPDYSDNGSEKALSNYAPSDIEDDLREPVVGDVEKSLKRSSERTDLHRSKVKKQRLKKREEEVDMQEEDQADSQDDISEESSERSKKKKKKRKKHKKHHKHRNEDFEEEDVFDSESEEQIFEKRSSKIDKKQRRARHKHEVEESGQRGHSRFTKSRKRSEKGHKHREKKQEHLSRKRKSEIDPDDILSEEEVEREHSRGKKKKSHRSSKEQRRRVSEEDEISLDEDNYSFEEERSPTPEETRKHKKRQKHKKSKKESSTKEVKSVASRIRL